MAPKPGTKIPDFTLKLSNKDGYTDFKLSEHLGKGPIVFAFFPLAFSGVCTTEVCDVRDNFATLAGLKAQVFGFSTDAAPANKGFIVANNLPFSIISDPNREFVGKVWPAMPTPVLGANNVAQRGAMIVNSDGTVKWSSASVDTKVWPGAAEIAKQLQN